jgi:hypothetical protein
MPVHFQQEIGHIDLEEIVAITIPKKGYSTSTDMEFKILFRNTHAAIEIKFSEEKLLPIHETITKEWLLTRTQ